jgi:hypothetical protein
MSADDTDPLGSGILRWLIKELDRISARYQPTPPQPAEKRKPESDKGAEDATEQQPREQEQRPRS